MALEYLLEIHTANDLTEALLAFFKEMAPGCEIYEQGSGMGIDMVATYGLRLHISSDTDGYVYTMVEGARQRYELDNYYAVDFQVINNMDADKQHNDMIRLVKGILQLTTADAWFTFDSRPVATRINGQIAMDNTWQFWDTVQERLE